MSELQLQHEYWVAFDHWPYWMTCTEGKEEGNKPCLSISYFRRGAGTQATSRA